MTGELAPRIGLVLAGGGGRAAYEAGVLGAIADMLRDRQRNPFPVLCGVSSGGLNAAALALAARDFGQAVAGLTELWQGIGPDDVYQVVGGGVFGGRASSLGGLLGMGGGDGVAAPLHTAPLRRLLEARFDFGRLPDAIASRSLLALCLICSGYGSGQSVVFFQGRNDLDPWQLRQRVGAHVALGVDHVLATMALPLLFPPIRINREFFGDGAMRELAPLSPPIHLGAERILVISGGNMAARQEERSSSAAMPVVAEVAGHVLAGIHADALTADIERMAQINQLVAALPAGASARAWRPIELLVIEPSERLDLMALRYLDRLPTPARRWLDSTGVTSERGGIFASYLMFGTEYGKALVDLGYRDATARRDEITGFLDISQN